MLPTLSLPAGAVLELTGSPGESFVKFGPSARLSASCLSDLATVVDYLSPTSFFSTDSPEGQIIKAQLRNVPMSCQDLGLGVPCVANDPSRPAMFRCKFSGEGSEVEVSPFMHANSSVDGVSGDSRASPWHPTYAAQPSVS